MSGVVVDAREAAIQQELARSAAHAPHRATQFGAWMLNVLAAKLGSADAAERFADAVMAPTPYGTPARAASDKACAQLVRNLVAVAEGA